MRPPVRLRLADQVVTVLLDAVLDGRFPPGSMLPPERDLAVEFDVNRTSLRQAIARLEQMGVVASRQGRGTVVNDVGASGDPALMAHLVARDRRRMLAELFEVRAGMARLIGRLAAERATAPQLRALRHALDGVRTAATTAARQDAEFALFNVLVAAAHNRALTAMQQWVDRAYGEAADLFVDAFADPGPVETGLAAIVEAVVTGDAGTAAATAEQYATASGERMLAAATRRPPRRPDRRGGTR